MLRTIVHVDGHGWAMWPSVTFTRSALPSSAPRRYTPPVLSFVRPLAPLGAVAVAILLRAAFFGRRYDPWLRLIAGAALALLSVGLFYPASDRYHYLAWLLTLLVTAVWMRDEGVALWQRWSPGSLDWVSRHTVRSPLAGVVERLAGCSAASGSRPTLVG